MNPITDWLTSRCESKEPDLDLLPGHSYLTPKVYHLWYTLNYSPRAP